MRIIKFRVWDTKSKKWHPYPFGLAIRITDGVLVTSVSAKKLSPVSEQFIYQQFTGLYDVNGKEIYEGDIIKHRYFSKKGVAEVRWNNEQGYYLAIEPDGSRIMLNPNSEIIGNIWEHTELLELS